MRETMTSSQFRHFAAAKRKQARGEALHPYEVAALRRAQALNLHPRE